MAKRKRTRLGRVRRVGKRMRRYFRRKDKRIPVLVTVAGVAPAATAIGKQWPNIQNGYFNDVPYELIHEYTGYSIVDGSFDSSKLIKTVATVLVAYGTSKVLTMAGVNKAIGRIPFVGKYIKL